MYHVSILKRMKAVQNLFTFASISDLFKYYSSILIIAKDIIKLYIQYNTNYYQSCSILRVYIFLCTYE